MFFGALISMVRHSLPSTSGLLPLLCPQVSLAQVRSSTFPPIAPSRLRSRCLLNPQWPLPSSMLGLQSPAQTPNLREPSLAAFVSQNELFSRCFAALHYHLQIVLIQKNICSECGGSEAWGRYKEKPWYPLSRKLQPLGS